MKTKKLKKTLKCFNTLCKDLQKTFVKFHKSIIKIFIVGLVATTETACNVVRVVSTESQYYQKGDTSVTITTRTTETYDATKKF